MSMTGVNGRIYFEKQRVTVNSNSNVGTLVEKGIAVASVFPFQSSSIKTSELDAPQSNRLSGHDDASLGQ